MPEQTITVETPEPPPPPPPPPPAAEPAAETLRLAEQAGAAIAAVESLRQQIAPLMSDAASIRSGIENCENKVTTLEQRVNSLEAEREAEAAAAAEAEAEMIEPPGEPAPPTTEPAEPPKPPTPWWQRALFGVSE